MTITYIYGIGPVNLGPDDGNLRGNETNSFIIITELGASENFCVLFRKAFISKIFVHWLFRHW